MIPCLLHKDHYVLPMPPIHRPRDCEFEAFRDEEDVESELGGFFLWLLCVILVIIGIVPLGQKATKSSGLK